MWKKQMFIFTLFKIFLIADICGFNVYALSKDDYIVNGNGMTATTNFVNNSKNFFTKLKIIKCIQLKAIQQAIHVFKKTII